MPGLPLLDAAGARAGDAAAVEAGDPWTGLMARAAGHLAATVLEVAGGGYGREVAVVVGRGDNGGDGWAAAPILARRGMRVTVVAPDGTDVDGSPAAGAARAAWLAAGGRTVVDPSALPARAEVVVDAVLGTGAQGPLRGTAVDACAAIARARGAGARVVACDVPSGVSADDGRAADGAVVADATVTFGALKRGLVLHPGAAHAGRVSVGGLGPRWPVAAGGWSALAPVDAAPPPRPVDDEKRRRGTVLVVGGGPSTPGAPALAGTGALAVGAGLTTVATPEPGRPLVAAHDPALMVVGLPSDERGALGAGAVHALPVADVVVAGPGLGTGAPVAELVAALLTRAGPLVLDADALNVLRDDPDVLVRHAGPLVLTPHARELARLGVGDDADDAWARRVELVPPLAARLSATIVVKGPGSLVVAPDGRVWVTPVGSPALATGGTGDVLAGTIAAAIAADPDDVPLAVARAVWWHAAAGELAGHAGGGRAGAGAVVAALPRVLALLAGWTAHPGPTPWGRSAPDWVHLRARLADRGRRAGRRARADRRRPS